MIIILLCFKLRLSESLEGAKKVFHFLADGEKGEITIDSFLEGLEKMGVGRFLV